ncbi:MAG: S-layer homology domain-containing protein [Oscillospiraceae bacterium]|nr:S-layer homology domain-containing protein [Oscillospiraceae bacterium]
MVEYTPQFTDVEGNAWYYGEVTVAASKRLVKGVNTAETLYIPEASVTRAEFAAMISRALMLPAANESTEAKTTVTADLKTKFTDSAVIENKYAKYVEPAVSLNLMQRMSATAFEAKSTVTRAQAAAVLIRMCKSFDWIE